MICSDSQRNTRDGGDMPFRSLDAFGISTLFFRHGAHKNGFQLLWSMQTEAIRRSRLQMLVCMVHDLPLVVQGQHERWMHLKALTFLHTF